MQVDLLDESRGGDWVGSPTIIHLSREWTRYAHDPRTILRRYSTLGQPAVCG